MRWLAMAAAAVTLAGCTAREPTVADAWVRLPAVPGRPAAAYFTARGGDLDVRLSRVESPAAARAEMHQSMANGMRPLSGVPVRAGAEVAFAPGGRHIMLFDPDPGLKPGDTTPLRLTFERIGETTLTIDAKVVGPADPAP